MILTRDEARALMTRALDHATADETEITLGGGGQGNLRFARNMPTTTGYADTLMLHVTSVFGKRVGSFATTIVDDDALATAVTRAEAAARIAPENPEYMPRLGPQTYREPAAWDDATAHLGPDARAATAAEAIRAMTEHSLLGAGYREDGSGFTAILNSRGLFAYHVATAASCTVTARTPDGTGSGWAAAESFAATHIDGARLTARAIEKALASRDPQPIDPGVYPVILEPSPAGDLLGLFLGSLDRRGAEEGRTYFAEAPHGTKLGHHLFGDAITITSDPTDSTIPSTPWGEDGLPLEPVTWVDRGTLANLTCSRYWAREKGHAPMPAPSNVAMAGDRYSLDDLVASMDHGLLVTSFWYIREVDPRSILFTGLTRDGLFLVERGRITRPLVNMRWNESPAAVYKNVEMLSTPMRAVSREGNLPTLVPAVKAGAFTFSSVSPST